MLKALIVILLYLPSLHYFLSTNIYADQADLNIRLNIDDKYTKGNTKYQLRKFAAKISHRAKIVNTAENKYYWLYTGKQLFTDFLKSLGYYDSKVYAHIDHNKQDTITFHIHPKEQYTISNIEISYHEDSNQNLDIPSLKDLKIKAGDALNAEKILDTKDFIKNYIELHNCLIELDVKYKVVIDYLENKAKLFFIINAGNKISVSDVEYQGISNKNTKNYVKKINPLKKNQCFSNLAVTNASNAIISTRLFDNVSHEVKTDPVNDSASVVFKLQERKKYKISITPVYSSQTNLGLDLLWSNNNVTGNRDKFLTTLLISKDNQKGEVSYSLPFGQHMKRMFTIGGKVERLIPYTHTTEKSFVLFAQLQDNSSKYFHASLGIKLPYNLELSYEYPDIPQSKDFYSFISLFSQLSYDMRDSHINPLRGIFYKLYIENFINIKQQEQSFTKAQIELAHYLPIIPNKITLAARILLDSIWGTNIEHLPENEKVYLGGSSSVRGYAYKRGAYQYKDQEILPLGKKYALSTMLECRVCLKKYFGLVMFLDSGVIADDFISLLQQKFIHGVGLGLRYQNSFVFGIDVAFPLIRRKKLNSDEYIDKLPTFHFTIGHKF